jgi:site-specific DNA-methyltransferase (adenine-specific)
MKIYKGDVLEQIDQLEDNSVDLVVTSPPYADQRAGLYEGISEEDYPEFTVQWMNKIKRVLKQTGNVAIVIRPHIKNGQISDYVLKTRLALRQNGWNESEELIWIKPTAPALGSYHRPRRSWESVLWFSKNGKSFCDPKANGTASSRVGMESSKGVGEYIAGTKKAVSGIARCRDYVEVGTHEVNKAKFNTHPAQYPEALVIWLIKLLCPEGGVVLDPFLGSGTTAIAAANNNRKVIGIEKEQSFIDIANKRYENEFGTPTFLKPKRVPEGKRFEPEAGWIAEMKVFVPKLARKTQAVRRRVQLELRRRDDKKVDVWQFDGIVGNPPYLGQQQVHQQFFNKSFHMLKNEGSLVFIQPATPYLNKKSPDKRKHEKAMQSIVTTNETKVKIVGPEVFEGAAIPNDLAITAIQKKPANAINVVQYKDGSTFKNVSLEHVNYGGMDPKVYAPISRKYQDYVSLNGSLLDATYYNRDKPVSNIVRLQKVRGNIGKADFITFMSNNQEYLSRSCHSTRLFS